MRKMGGTVAAVVRGSSGAQRADSLKRFAYLVLQKPIPVQQRIGSKTLFPRCNKYARGTRGTHGRHLLSHFDSLPPRCELRSAELHLLKSLKRAESMQEDVPLCCVVTTTIKPRDRTQSVSRERRGRIATCLFKTRPFSGVALSRKG